MAASASGVAKLPSRSCTAASDVGFIFQLPPKKGLRADGIIMRLIQGGRCGAKVVEKQKRNSCCEDKSVVDEGAAFVHPGEARELTREVLQRAPCGNYFWT